MARKKKKFISTEEKYEVVFESTKRYSRGFARLFLSIPILGVSMMFFWFGVDRKIDFLALFFFLISFAGGGYYFYVAMYCFFSKNSFPTCILKNNELHIYEYAMNFGRVNKKITDDQTINIHNIENIRLKNTFFKKILVLKFDLKKDSDSYQVSEILSVLNLQLTKKDKVRFKNEIEQRKENGKFRI